MRIIIKDLNDLGVNLGETTLCDGAAKGSNVWMGPDGLAFDGQVEPQVQGFMRAMSKKVWNRNNHAISVSFKCNRDCGSTQAAEAFIIQFYATCKRGTQLVLSTSAIGGTSSIRINNAVLQGIKLAHIGVLVHAEFSIIGGSIS